MGYPFISYDTNRQTISPTDWVRDQHTEDTFFAMNQPARRTVPVLFKTPEPTAPNNEELSSQQTISN